MMPTPNEDGPESGCPAPAVAPDWRALARGPGPWRMVSGGRVLAGNLDVAADPLRRAVGLLARGGLPAGRVLALFPCGAVHTAFMRFPLDVVFLDREGCVLRRVAQLPPWRVASGGKRAFAVLEAQAGWLPPEVLHEGDRVAFLSPETRQEA